MDIGLGTAATTLESRFGDLDKPIEFGGTWVAPRWQHSIGAELERYSLSLIESPAPSSYWCGCCWSNRGWTAWLD